MNNEVLEQLKQEYNETFNRLQDLGEVIANCADIDTNHCGHDAEEARSPGFTYKDLLGMEVIGFGGMASTCAHCSDNIDCVKVELVGGDYICLAKPRQEKPKVISFDEEEGNVMDDIKQKAEDFLDYLEGIVKTEGQ